MSKKQFNQRQKPAILKSTERMSAGDAANIAGTYFYYMLCCLTGSGQDSSEMIFTKQI